MDTTSIDTSDYKNAFLGTESPIEEKLLSALKKLGVTPQMQVSIGNYRVDMLIDSKYRKIVVECDGEAFHQDRKHEQIRDEYLESHGFFVIHFTGSQISRDATQCAITVIENISEVYGSQEFQDWLEQRLSRQVVSETLCMVCGNAADDEMQRLCDECKS